MITTISRGKSLISKKQALDIVRSVRPLGLLACSWGVHMVYVGRGLGFRGHDPTVGEMEGWVVKSKTGILTYITQNILIELLWYLIEPV